MKPLSECGCLVVGGTAGVGLASAIALAREGARVALGGRDAQRGEAACAALRAEVPHAEVSFIQGDAADAAAALNITERARAALTTIDVLVCTTGPSHAPELLDSIPIDQISVRLDEIVLPPLHMMHAVLPAMRAQRSGSVVIVASDAAKVATPGETIVGAAMAAIVMFSRTAALEAKREGVRINLLTPSLIANTPGARLIETSAFAKKLFEKAATQAHLGVAEPEDLASMVVYLASPAARRITGQAISINGGISVA